MIHVYQKNPKAVVHLMPPRMDGWGWRWSACNRVRNMGDWPRDFTTGHLDDVTCRACRKSKAWAKEARREYVEGDRYAQAVSDAYDRAGKPYGDSRAGLNRWTWERVRIAYWLEADANKPHGPRTHEPDPFGDALRAMVKAAQRPRRA